MNFFSKKVVFLIIAALVVAVAIVLYFAVPPYLYHKAAAGLRKEAGLSVKSVDIPGFKIVYAEGGTGETIILLHGFSANKDHWLRFAKNFTSGYRVIIPDLPGFGESAKPVGEKYNIMAQTERLKLLAGALNLTQFHLAGNSMGGNIAANIAVAYPDMVKTLTLIDASGVTPPVPSERDRMIEKGMNPYLVRSAGDFNRLMALNFYRPPDYPWYIQRYLAREASKARPMNEKICKDLKADYGVLQSKLNNIHLPVLIVWGDTDKSIHISAMDVFAGNIRKSKTAVIRECGHLPMLEKPQETAMIYAEFLRLNK